MANPKYRSKFEGEVAKRLPKRARFEETKLEYVLHKKYIPDFHFKTRNGVVYIEAKGRFRNNDQQKLLAVKRQNPDVKIVLVFQNPDLPVRKGAKITMSMWAEKNGFPWYGLDSIPKRW